MARASMLTNAANATTGKWINILGPKMALAIVGTFDGGTVALEATIDGVNALPANYQGGGVVELTDEIVDLIIDFLPQTYQIRLVTSGGGGSMSVTGTLTT